MIDLYNYSTCIFPVKHGFAYNNAFKRPIHSSPIGLSSAIRI